MEINWKMGKRANGENWEIRENCEIEKMRKKDSYEKYAKLGNLEKNENEKKNKIAESGENDKFGMMAKWAEQQKSHLLFSSFPIFPMFYFFSVENWKISKINLTYNTTSAFPICKNYSRGNVYKKVELIAQRSNA